MWEHVFSFFTALARREPEALATGLTGFLVGALFSVAWRRRQSRLESELHQLSLRRAQEIQEGLTHELEEARENLVAARSSAQRLIEQTSRQQSQIFDLELQLQRARQESGRRKRHLKDLSRQIRQVVDTDGKTWETPVPAEVPAFTPRDKRRAVIVAVLNLKGGVGKTTVSANLGATLASQQEQVLLVDLDYQHSLSDLCFPEQQRDDLLAARRLVDRLFEPGGQTMSAFAQWLARVGDSTLQAVVADEDLQEAEERVRAAWLLGESGVDVRFLLRGALHAPAVADQFDWILLDCPPRLTTAAVNALCAADYVLVPTQIDAVSANAVPRLLRWLARLKHLDRLCPHLELLGVLANRTQQLKQFTAKEQTRWSSLQGQCSPRWPQPIHFFRQFVPDKADFAHAASESRFAVDDSAEIRARFLDLVDEIRSRVPQQCKSHS